jgi:hypothetical protein
LTTEFSNKRALPEKAADAARKMNTRRAKMIKRKRGGNKIRDM